MPSPFGNSRFGHAPEDEADVIVALGGDGFMLHTLHRTQALDIPVYGMNRGTVGFLMNEYSETDLIERLVAAAEEVINPLAMRAESLDGTLHEALAINEVSLLRAAAGAARSCPRLPWCGSMWSIPRNARSWPTPTAAG